MKLPRSGLLALFTKHPTAANLLMILMVMLGLASLTKLNRQFFPDFGIDAIQVSVPWPGASAEDVDANIVAAVEPEIRFLDGVDDVRSIAFEGAAVITLEYAAGYDMQEALSGVESAVAGITTLPADSEDPQIKRITRFDLISRLVISGPYSEQALKSFAKRIRDDLLARGIDKVDISGFRDEEIWVEVDPGRLRQLDLTLDDISRTISGKNQDLPSGKVGDGQLQIRTVGQVDNAFELEDLVVKANSSGTKVRLRDIALVREAFNKDQATLLRKGQPAVELVIQRALNADALKLANIVNDYLNETTPTLPPQLKMERYGIQADLIKDRINLLLENGLSGLILVTVVLFLFLNARIAFWVAIGIPVAVMATMLIMLATGQTINMISLFGMIMAIGIVVDDAIVVGEHADHLSRQGMTPADAALGGAVRMSAPVVSATLTTVSAFLPLMLIGGIIGDIIRAIPLVVVAILMASLLECFLILPHHMKGALEANARGNASRFRHWFDQGFEKIRNGFFRKLVSFAISWRYATIALAFALLIMAFGLLAGGRITFVFFEDPEPDTVVVGLEMVAGTPRQTTEKAIVQVDDALQRTLEKLEQPDLVVMSLTAVGRFLTGGVTNASTETLAGIRAELSPTDSRNVRTQELVDLWREEVGEILGLKSLSIRGQRGGPPGRDVDVRINGSDLKNLKAASEFLMAELKRFPGVSDVEDSLPYGKPEELLELNDRGLALGLDLTIVGEQLRHALEGSIAQRFARGDEEITVRVKYPENMTGLSALDQLHVTTSGGNDVSLLDAVDTTRSYGFAQIQRVDGRREVAVTAELNKSMITTGEITSALQEPGPNGQSILDKLQDQFDVTYQFRGKSEEQAETFADMQLGGMTGLALIYIILAWVFGSFFRPLAIILTIPLGLIGAILGHYLQGFNMSILSMIAMIGLSGIVINDSIVLITNIDQNMKKMATRDAIIQGAVERFRAVLLTSMTTVGGLTPLLFETSRQASFLIPMATTIVFGLGIATFLILLVVPCYVAVQEDVKDLLGAVGKKSKNEVPS